MEIQYSMGADTVRPLLEMWRDNHADLPTKGLTMRSQHHFSSPSAARPQPPGRVALLIVLGLASLPGVSDPLHAQEVVVPPGDDLGYVGLSWTVPDVAQRYEERRFPVIASIRPCSPAHVVGLEPGDVLRTVNGRDARRSPAFSPGGPGTLYEVEVERKEERLIFRIEAAPRPESVPAPIAHPPLGPPEDWNCESYELKEHD